MNNTHEPVNSTKWSVMLQVLKHGMGVAEPFIQEIDAGSREEALSRVMTSFFAEYPKGKAKLVAINPL